MVTHQADIVLDFFRNRLDESMPEKQTPDVYAIMCGDSRNQSNQFSSSPANRIFVTRTIGNQVIGVLGSAAYPTSHLHSVRLVVVVGHIGCGAVGGAHDLSKSIKPAFQATSAEEAITKTLYNLKDMGRMLIHSDAEEAINDEMLPMATLFANAARFVGDDEKPYLPKHAELNVHFQIATLLKLKELRENVGSGKLMVIGAVYDFLGRYGKPGSSYIVNINGRMYVEDEAKKLGLNFKSFLANP